MTDPPGPYGPPPGTPYGPPPGTPGGPPGGMPYGAYGSPYGSPYGGPVAQRGAGMATAALVAGIVALLFCWTVLGGIVLGLLAVVFAIVGIRRANRGAPGKGRAIAGLITGGLGLLLAVALLAFGLSVLNSSSTKNFEQCVTNAQGNQAQIRQCDTQYQRSFGG